MATVRASADSRYSARKPRVIVEYAVVNSEDAQVLAQRQGAVIRELLEWLHAHAGQTLETGHT